MITENPYVALSSKLVLSVSIVSAEHIFIGRYK
jgi:hypothetical protein